MGSRVAIMVAGACLGACLVGGPAVAQVDGALPAPGMQHIEAGPISVEFTLDRAELNVAESVVATLRVTAPDGVAVELGAAAEKLGEFSVASTVDEPAQSEGDGRTKMVRRITLEPFLPGEYTVPEIEVRWRRGGATGVARTAPVSVRVVSLLPADARAGDQTSLDPGSIRDTYVTPVKRNWMPLILGAATGISAALLTGWGARTLRRRRPSKDLVEALVQQVHALRAAPDLTGAELGHHLSGALHGALADRLGSSFLSLTARDAAARLGGTALPLERAQRCHELMEELDTIRFSGGSITTEQRERLIAGALDLLRALRDMPRAERGVTP